MSKRIFFALALFALRTFAQANAQSNDQWVLQQSTLTYHVSHPLHQVEGVSHAARGKGVCQAGQCQFLIAAPVKSFDSGDSNRDLHMLQVVRGGEFPMITVRTQIPEQTAISHSSRPGCSVCRAKTAHYAQVPFQLVVQGDQIRITGTIPATLADFKNAIRHPC